MSASHLALVLAHSRSKGVTRLVAISLCNSYDPEGDYSIASVETLCREANASSVEVHRAFHNLERLGEWSTIKAHGKDVMRLHMQCPLDCDRTAQHRTVDEFAALNPIPGGAS